MKRNVSHQREGVINPKDPALTVLMPVYNEAKTVLEAIDALEVCDLGLPFECLIIDDGSTDGTSELIDKRAERADWIRVVRHERNGGKGKAIRTGLDNARGRFTTIYDADLEYDPQDMAGLVTAMVHERGDAAFGVRAFGGVAAHSYLYVLGNRSVTWAMNVLFNCYIRDMMTCFKLMPTELFRSLDITSSGFELEAEITSKLISRGYRIYEVPISYAARQHDEGKKLKTSDAWRVLATLLKVRLKAPSKKQRRQQQKARSAWPRPTEERNDRISVEPNEGSGPTGGP